MELSTSERLRMAHLRFREKFRKTSAPDVGPRTPPS
jgi:hypothetical protein